MRRKLVTLLAALLIVLVIAEVGLRIAGRVYLKDLYQQLDARPNDINIMCLGESSTQGLWLDFKDSYPKQLEVRLREHFKTERIRTIVPPHVGQNTSQIANRIENYLRRYQPKLLLVMAGVNNEWALGESHITKFLGWGSSSWPLALKIRLLIWADHLRTFKAMRYLYIRATNADDNMGQDPNTIWGHPEYYPYPPPAEIYSFARNNIPAFVKLWEYDLRLILEAAKEANVPVFLMTYHLHPRHLDPAILDRLAQKYGATVIRNDRVFAKFVQNKSIGKYLLKDNWHPNADGYRIIADTVLQEIVQRHVLQLSHDDSTDVRREDKITGQ
jgi:lysophospholipase L1-like esterase